MGTRKITNILSTKNHQNYFKIMFKTNSCLIFALTAAIIFSWDELVSYASYASVGCYSYSSGVYDVFLESLTSAQCSAAATSNGLSCDVSSSPSYPNLLDDFSSHKMTVEICLSICTSNSFTYAGLSS